MVMRTIYPINEKQMIEFVKLFPSSKISSLEFTMYNGTETRGKDLPGDVHFTNPNFTLHGNTLEAILNALKLVDYNQMQKICITLKETDNYRSCMIDALERSIYMGSPNLIDFNVLRKFCEVSDIEKLNFRI
jgi:hypothetical protein